MLIIRIPDSSVWIGAKGATFGSVKTGMNRLGSLQNIENH